MDIQPSGAAMDIQPSGAAMGIQPSGDINFESLVLEADPLVVQNRQDFEDIGEHCRTMEQAHSDLGCIVRRLRDKGIVLADFASFNVAKMYIQSRHQFVRPDTLEKYTCHLRQLLGMSETALPEHISITAPLPQWIMAGDDVAGIDSENHWWHAVALEVTKKGVSVYWVGFEPETVRQRSRYKGNPEWVPMSMLRAHDAKSVYVKTGPNKMYDVAWIKQRYPPMPKTFEDSIVVGSSSDEDNSDDIAAAAKAERAAAAKAEKAAAAKAAAVKAAAVKAAAAKAVKDKAAALKRIAEPRTGSSRKRSATNAADDSSSVLSVQEVGNDESDDDEDNSSDGDDDTEDNASNDDNNDDDKDDADDDDNCNDGESMHGTGDDGSSRLHSADAASAPDCPLGNDADAQVKFRAMLNVFHDVEAAIVCLMGLDSGLPVHPSLFADMSKKLISVARFSAVHYGNTAFDTLASETLRELADYQGQQKPKLPHTGNIEP